MQTRHDAFRTNDATVLRNSTNLGEAFTRKEAYLALLALVSGLVLNTMPDVKDLDGLMPNNEFGNWSTYMYIWAWWCVMISVLDALFTTVFAAIFSVIPSVLQPTILFGVGVWLSFLFWTMVFAYRAFGPSIEEIQFVDAPFSVHFMYFICALIFGVLGIPVLLVFRCVQYDTRIRLPAGLQKIFDFDVIIQPKPDGPQYRRYS